MRFEWDPVKERRNRVKHGVDFSLARVVFADPGLSILYDRFEGSEHRWRAVGLIGAVQLLVVVHSYPDESDQELIRVIGLRRATKVEQGDYFDGQA